jgi:phosphatidylserine decarboxylase
VGTSHRLVFPDNLFIGKLINAWTQTPTKWYPLPIAVGALLLVAIQYRKKSRRARKEVDVDEDGLEVIKLKGPWHVRILSNYSFSYI